MALSCVHFPMFVVETQAVHPLKTGDNICPPSLSVLPSIMVRPLSTLHPFVHTTLPSLFLLLFNSTSSLRPITPSAKQAEPGHLRCYCCFFTTAAFSLFTSFLQEDIQSSFSTSLTPLCLLICILTTVLGLLFQFLMCTQ